jgi:hypothetical protein
MPTPSRQGLIPVNTRADNIILICRLLTRQTLVLFAVNDVVVFDRRYADYGYFASLTGQKSMVCDLFEEKREVQAG